MSRYPLAVIAAALGIIGCSDRVDELEQAEMKLESNVRYLGVEVEDALELVEQAGA